MATTSVPNSSKAIGLKLLVDKNSNKVLFAEAGKEFVDFLFGLIHIPIGSIMGLLRTHGRAGPGALSGVYESIQSLDPSCLHQSKDSFLMPQPAFPSDTHPPPLLKNFLPPKQDTRTRQVCRTEDQVHDEFFKRLFEQKKETGYVRGVVTFMVMDDLTVKPMSTISSITLLNTFNVKDVSSLQEKTVNVDIKKGLELVKASFGSTTVLTDVFVGNKMATTSIPNSSKAIRLKLLVDKNSNKVLFAEAGKEFVDFLFGLIHIPIGSIMGLLRTHGIAGPGALSGVYESIQSLDPSCLHQSKDSFLMPRPAFPSDTHPPPLLKNFLPPKQDTRTRQVCRTEDQVHDEFIKRLFEQKKETGYVRGVVTFMVMDDLTVKPMSTISSITLLNTFNVKDVSSLQEKTVNVDIKKGLELVKASFGSTTVLTDVFVGNKVVLEELP